MSPFSIRIFSRSAYRSEIFSPFFFSNILAPGYSSGPFRTSFSRKFLFISFTEIGFVIFFAIFKGIPSSRIDKLGSGVITERAEKSTRFPIKLPLTRPPFPFSLSMIDLSGRPERCATWPTPGILLLICVAI